MKNVKDIAQIIFYLKFKNKRKKSPRGVLDPRLMMKR